jgi:predicted dienelactone hydrolase
MRMLRHASLVAVIACGGPPQQPGEAIDAATRDAPMTTRDAALADATQPLYDPSQPGPWRVGVHTMQLTDPARARTFAVEVWYPVDPQHVDGSDNRYELDIIIPIASIASPARRDATPAPGTWPLVAFSHGYGGIRFQSYFMTEQLASHGFVVVAPDHPGNTLADFTQLGNAAATAQSAIDRPLDLIATIDAALAGQLGVALPIDPARIGATGHSFGGWTCLEVARRDPRVRAVFPLAPGFRDGATPDFVATLARPVLFVGGSADHTCAFPANQQAPYDLAQTPKFLLEVMGAGHLDFSNLCEVPLAQQFVHDGCDPASIDPDIVHRRANTVATAFALRYLDDLVGYDPALGVGEVTALGNVTYTAAP